MLNNIRSSYGIYTFVPKVNKYFYTFSLKFLRKPYRQHTYSHIDLVLRAAEVTRILALKNNCKNIGEGTRVPVTSHSLAVNS